MGLVKERIMDFLKRLTSWGNVVVAMGLVFIVLYPLIGGRSYILHLFILFFIWGVVAANWNLLTGYAGITSLGNVGFLAIGGYVSGILAKSLGISPWITIPIGGIASMVLVAVFLGLPALRLKGIYIALLTLIFADTLPSILTQTRDVTGGAMGLHDIPPFFNGMEKIHAYYICFAFFLIAQYIMAGGFYVHSLGDISPTTLAIEPFLLAITMMELGGMGTFFGPILGSAIIVFGSEFLRLAGTLRLSLLGALICVIVLFFPGGLMQLVEQLERWVRERIRSKRSSLAT
jgi:branched-chain amino acid transport system permease protein